MMNKFKYLQSPIIKKLKLTRISKKNIILILFSIFLLLLASLSVFQKYSLQKKLDNLYKEKSDIETLFSSTEQELQELRNQDQVKTNIELKETIENIEDAYDKAVSSYEELLKLKENDQAESKDLDELFTKSLVELSNQEYTTAEATLAELNKKTKAEVDRLASLATPKVTAPESNTPPGSGYSRQYVTTDTGSFLVSMVVADIGSTRMIVDTAAD